VLIPRGGLILPQSRESAEVRAQPYSSGAHRPCSAKAITLAPPPNFPSRKAVILMPRRSTTSTYRRHAWADSKFRSGTLAMRSCSSCLRANALCVVSPSSPKCEQCVRHNRQCELASPVDQLDKLSEQENKLLDQITESEARTRRLRKQRRLLLKKMRDLGDREAQNIFELEVDEMLSEAPAEPAEVLNPSSPRSSSFLDPALLGSPDRTPAEPLGSQ
jgi:hypothetical protein